MLNYSLIFARTLQDAENSALIDWKWEPSNEMRFEFRRPDNNERARYVIDDGGQTLQGLRWNTRVYLGRDWRKRRDASMIMGHLDAGFFAEVDPELPPPRPRRTRDDRLRLIEQQLKELK